MELIIVESPTKANTLNRFLGSGYDVIATKGHIKDLPKSKIGINIEKNFKPDYVFILKKEDVVKNIRDRAKKAEKIYLATDPDREGEAISAHVKEVLEDSKSKVADSKLKRIVFHEITKEAVEEAIRNPRDVDVNLVNAQVARRVLDRLVGYKLSPLLWKKVRRGLSAGRVQSVAVRLIVEKEREIEAFKSEEYWEIGADVSRVSEKNKNFVVSLVKVGDKKAEVKNKETAESIVSDLEKSSYEVLSVNKKEVKKNPYPPFTTSTMTQGAARIFGWSAKKTMAVAQKLYEEGLITYHRTDSLNVSEAAIKRLREFITKEYGQSYLSEEARFYKTNSKVAQEAHEAIRPTNVNTKADITNGYTKDDEKLYGLVWKRFVSTQMSASIFDETAIDVSAEGKRDYMLHTSGQIMKFDGWRKLYNGKAKEEDVIILPDVKDGEPLQLNKVLSEQKFTQPPARFSEAMLIKTLEKLGIGRPSTYAPTISTIQIRNYVEKVEGRFHPTPIGVAVNDFLMKNFPDVFDYAFTAQMEDGLDEIANGKAVWSKTIQTFWDPFNKKLGSVEKKSERVKIEVEKLGKPCPECKEGELVIRIGRFGKFISCSRFPDCKYTDKYVEKIDMKCPECGKGGVVVKKTKKGKRFYGCSRYPECQWASWKNPKPQENLQN